MKKLFTLILVVMLLLALAGCGGEPEAPTPNWGSGGSEVPNIIQPPDTLQTDNVDDTGDELPRYSIDLEQNPEIPEMPAPTPTVEISVSNESELRQAVGQSGNTPVVITITSDIELISNFIIPDGADITLRSADEPMFNLIVDRSMDVISIERNASLRIENIGIKRVEGTSGSGVFNAGVFTMSGGFISGHTNSGVRSIGIFTMYGGTISDNVSTLLGSSARGGGVTINMNGIFTMNGGTISDNTVRGNGGGVSVNGTFIMNGGTIRDNVGSGRSFGGGVHIYQGNFIMHGGVISGNTVSNRGGGVSGGAFTMYGGVISGNTASEGGGVSSGAFTMYGGTIYGNTGTRTGGGISIGLGVLTIHDGMIHANSGGGVNIEGNGAMTIYGGWIFDNAADNGVDIRIGGVFNNNIFDANNGAIGNPPPGFAP